MATTTIPSTIDIEDVTAKDGSGSFDLLMKSMQEKLDVQYSNNRIKGTDYANACISLLQSTLTQSIEFTLLKDKTAIDIDIAKQNLLLVKAQISKMGKEEDLIDAQIIKMSEDTKLTQAQITKLGKDGTLVDAQVVKLAEDTKLTQAQVSKLSKDELLVDAQITKMGEDTKLTTAQISKLGKDEDLVDKQIDKMIQDIKVSTEQVEKIKSEVIVIKAKGTTAGNEALASVHMEATALATKEQAQEQATLATWKVSTEQSNTKDDVTHIESDGTSKTSYKVTGSVGAKNEVYKAQKDGFVRDSEQKLLKIMSDAFNVQYTTDPTLGADYVEGVNAAAQAEFTAAAGNTTKEAAAQAKAVPKVGVADYGLGYENVQKVVIDAASGIGLVLTPDVPTPPVFT